MHPHLSPEDQFVHYVKGDATNPQGSDLKLIIHINNNLGAWGAGFVLAVSKKWKKPEQSYKIWKEKFPHLFHLGEIQFVPVEQDVIVVNMIAQNGLRSRNNPNPLDYEALSSCLSKISKFEGDFSVHAPRIGSGLGGGDWKVIESLLIKYLICRDISVTIYDLP